jgi:chemotaxis regulatin CheY-phosphate phosphatase CheZ
MGNYPLISVRQVGIVLNFEEVADMHDALSYLLDEVMNEPDAYIPEARDRLRNLIEKMPYITDLEKADVTPLRIGEED